MASFIAGTTFGEALDELDPHWRQSVDWNAPSPTRPQGLSDDDRLDIQRRFESGERAIFEHDQGECNTCDELRRLANLED